MSIIAGVLLAVGQTVENRTLEDLGTASGGVYSAQGAWREGSVGLIHRALPVVPEDVRAAQPLRDEQGDLTIIADVRLDNRIELLRELREVEPASPDVALLLAAYERWGEGCLARLQGDFAFAIWDGRKGQLLAARDPMGMRALYYVEQPGRFLFASTVTQLLAVPGVPVELDKMALAAYLVAAPPRLDGSFYRGVRSLPPAHALLRNALGEGRMWRYWDVDPAHRITYADERDYEAHFLDVFQQAVRSRMRSRAPAGVLLSGGLDSGSIASVAGWLRERGEASADLPLHTFSFAHEHGAAPDERHVSDHIVRHYGFAAHVVPAHAAWPLKGYPAHGPHRDSPMVGAYQVLLEHALARARGKGVRLLLVGHRGDLVMGEGIYDYPALFWSGQWRAMLGDLSVLQRGKGWPLRTALAHAFAAPIRRSFWPGGAAERLRLWRRRALRRRRGAMLHPGWVRTVWHERVEADRALDPVVRPPDGLSYARRERYLSIFSPFHVHVSEWLGRTFAHFGITHADPWSDRRLAEFALAVPQRVLNRPGEHKRLVRRAMAGIMPEPARFQAGKMSPEPLLDEALRVREQRTVEDLITAPRAAAYGLVDEGALGAAYEAYAGGAVEPLLWYTLSLEMWLRRFHP